MRKEASIGARPEHYHLASSSHFEILSSSRMLVHEIQQLIQTRCSEIAIVTLTLDFEYAEKGYSPRSANIAASTHYILESLRPLVRKTDLVVLLEQTAYFILPTASAVGGAIVQERLWEALLWNVHNLQENEIIQPSCMSMGYGAHPEPHIDIYQCILAARQAQLQFSRQPERGPRRIQAPLPPVSVVQEQSQPSSEELPLIARRMGMPYLSSLPRDLPERVRHVINPRLAQELRCYPLGRERNTLTVAIDDPQNRTIMDRLQQETGLHIFPVLTNPHELHTALEQLF